MLHCNVCMEHRRYPRECSCSYMRVLEVKLRSPGLEPRALPTELPHWKKKKESEKIPVCFLKNSDHLRNSRSSFYLSNQIQQSSVHFLLCSSFYVPDRFMFEETGCEDS